MLATNIPTTIFTLLAFLQRVKASWVDALLSVPEVGLCLFQLTALALTPDRIHREVHACLIPDILIDVAWDEDPDASLFAYGRS